MTATDHTVVHALSVQGLEYDFARRHTIRPDDGELHLLRLAVDLQVDAMLLALTAAARDHGSDVPWQRWLVEDLDVARKLTACLISSDADQSPALGEVASGVSHDPLDNLVARYTSMDDLLTSVLDRPYSGQQWRASAADARVRCRARLEELHVHRTAALERQAMRLAAAADPVTDPLHRQAFLPGELLG